MYLVLIPWTNFEFSDIKLNHILNSHENTNLMVNPSLASLYFSPLLCLYTFLIFPSSLITAWGKCWCRELPYEAFNWWKVFICQLIHVLHCPSFTICSELAKDFINIIKGSLDIQMMVSVVNFWRRVYP